MKKAILILSLILSVCYLTGCENKKTNKINEAYNEIRDSYLKILDFHNSSECNYSNDTDTYKIYQCQTKLKNNIIRSETYWEKIIQLCEEFEEFEQLKPLAKEGLEEVQSVKNSPKGNDTIHLLELALRIKKSLEVCSDFGTEFKKIDISNFKK